MDFQDGEILIVYKSHLNIISTLHHNIHVDEFNVPRFQTSAKEDQNIGEISKSIPFSLHNHNIYWQPLHNLDRLPTNMFTQGQI